MHKRRPKAMRGKHAKVYMRTIEEKNYALRRRVQAMQEGTKQISGLVNGILAELVDRFGAFDIEIPKENRPVSVKKENGRLYIALPDADPDENKDAREPYTRGKQWDERTNT